MNTHSTTTHIFSRQPLSVLGKLTFWSLLTVALLCALIWSVTAHSSGLLTLTLSVFLSAGLVLTGFRWTPLLGALTGAAVLYIFAGEPFVVFHLTQPKGELFVAFVIIVIVLACAIIALGAGLSSTVQNYRNIDRHAPRWLTPALTCMAGIVIGAVFIGAISQPTVAANSAPTSGEPTVHLGPNNFVQPTVTVPKGSKLLLVDDGSFIHFLSNGSWQNGTAVHATEAGAPTLNNLQISNGNKEIGPFNTSGTYHIYCTVHQGMNLTVIVQ